MAILSHKETLEKMENIAKMQKGEPYDKTLIPMFDSGTPKITDEEISKQRRLLEELQSRPLIVDKSSRLLTTKPLPERKKAPMTVVTQMNQASAKRKPKRFLPSKAVASGSCIGADELTGDISSCDPSNGNVGKDKQEAHLLLALLTSVLGRIDGASAAPIVHDSKKGKQKEKLPLDEGTLTDALKGLLPLLSNTVTHTCESSSVRTAQVSNSSSLSTSKSWKGMPQSLEGFSTQSKIPQIFKTTEETYYKPPPDRLHDQHWTVTKSSLTYNELPKVREDAHPVPGGGWARGRSLVPRTAVTAYPISHPDPILSSEHAVSDTANFGTISATQVQLDKENKPPTPERGLKRTLSFISDAKEPDSVSSKSQGKKRRQGIIGTDETRSVIGRTVMGSTGRNKTSTNGASGSKTVASSPVTSTASTRARRTLPVVAVSEPDLTPPLPIVATTSLDLIIDPPRTPPQRKKSLEVDAGDSLFTPCAPALTPQFSGSAVLTSPSPVRRSTHCRQVDKISTASTATECNAECSASGLELKRVKTGWDLPPSSPPPPTSPIEPHAHMGSESEDIIPFDLSSQPQNGLDVGMEKGGIDGRFEDHGAAIKCADVSTHISDDSGFHSPLPTSDYTSDFGPFSDGDFDLGVLSQADMSEGIDLDIDELWKTLGPVIAQAHSDNNIAANSEASSQVEADFNYFDLGNQTQVDSEESGADAVNLKRVDAVKLAEDLKALFGGCVV
ncbi:hypothetical protein K439DRAFT_539869 [Ramaria rubella]|nr:hypothetical protein K439DRAFT_539869 [Ramaria rubella]